MANLDLSKYGIKDVKEIIHNPSYVGGKGRQYGRKSAGGRQDRHV